MSLKKKILQAAFAALCMVSMLLIPINQPIRAYAATSAGFVILDTSSRTLKIGDEYHLRVVTSNGKRPTFRSSDTKIASVNTYGTVTGKKPGTAKITAKIKNAEASCTIRVEKTKIYLSADRITLENGCSADLVVTSSTGHTATFRSDKKSVAVVDESGNITAKKPGRASITVTVDQITKNCIVIVKKPSVTLSKTAVSLYRKGTVRLTARSTSKSTPVWKSSKKSVAVVDGCGTVTAVKNGTAIVTVTVDGVSKSCEVTVKRPEVRFEKSQITLRAGRKKNAKVFVSSGNKPVFSSSNTCIATVDEDGKIFAHEKGKAYIYASEDGVKSRIQVIVK